MNVTTLASVTRKKDKETKNLISVNEPTPFTFESLEKFVFVSGATRKPEYNNIEILNNYGIHFSKLRPPLCRPRKKQIHKEKLINKSCEKLLECIKPCKNIKITRETKITQSSQISRNIFKKNEFIYEKKATSKVQFFSVCEVCEETPEAFLFMRHQDIEEPNKLAAGETEELPSFEKGNLCSLKSENIKNILSSEDFVNNVFS